MYRLIYWSQSTIPVEKELIQLREILTEAMRFNQAHDITGVLYFGQSYFMQCLEGNKHDVETIYAKIQSDPRHQSVNCLFADHVENRLFDKWDMSFVRQKSKELAFFSQLGLKTFEPFRLDRVQVEQFLHHLYGESTQDSRQFAVNEF